MTVMSDDLVAVTYDDCCLIDIININTEKIWKRIKTIDSCFKISHENGLIYAAIKDTMIKVMNMAGNVIRSFSSPSFFISFIKVDKERLFLTDYHDNILYCCNLQGQVMWKFQGKELKELHGVTTDKHDNVYIAGAFSHNVIVISNTGTHFKELINKSDKVIQPIAIFYDKSNDCLLVCNAKGSVFLFDIIHQSSEVVKRKSTLRRSLSDIWSRISPK
ncbi:Hypothetical predicted protein [Mytilus galloprovincialis]|uniref:Uncharacterized protein n=1 Tax=Mytilus galloprovincialis TaxID=29158 RepID=A0A8B6G0K1_MYTGA|nr:Hypothetical predicted protein [Mytilus galloprovincialis]